MTKSEAVSVGFELEASSYPEKGNANKPLPCGFTESFAYVPFLREKGHNPCVEIVFSTYPLVKTR